MFFVWLVIVSSTCVFLIGGGILWLADQRAAQRVTAVESHLRALRGDVAALCVCQSDTVKRDQARELYVEQSVRVVETRLEAMEQRLRQIARRQDEQIHTSEPGETSYGAAIRLAHQGADVEQLVNTFGLSRGEAELIAALHRTQNQTG